MYFVFVGSKAFMHCLEAEKDEQKSPPLKHMIDPNCFATGKKYHKRNTLNEQDLGSSFSACSFSFTPAGRNWIL